MNDTTGTTTIIRADTTYRVWITPDTETHIDEFDCYDQAEIAAWRADEWCFVTVWVAPVCDCCGNTDKAKAATLSGVHYGQIGPAQYIDIKDLITSDHSAVVSQVGTKTTSTLVDELIGEILTGDKPEPVKTDHEIVAGALAEECDPDPDGLNRLRATHGVEGVTAARLLAEQECIPMVAAVNRTIDTYAGYHQGGAGFAENFYGGKLAEATGEMPHEPDWGALVDWRLAWEEAISDEAFTFVGVGGWVYVWTN